MYTGDILNSSIPELLDQSVTDCAIPNVHYIRHIANVGFADLYFIAL